MNLIDNILTEWAYRVDDGMPNINHPLHIIQLRESMEELNLPKDFIFEFIQNLLTEEKKFYARNPKGKKISVFTDKDNYEKAVKGGYEPVDREEAEKELANQSDEEEPEKQTQQGMKIDPKGGLGGEDEKEDKEDIGVGEQRTHLRDTDHETTNKQLTISKIEAKTQAKQKGKKGVGLGTPESRAGEAAVHYAVRELVSGKSIDDVKKVLMGLAKDKDKILDTKWATAALNTAEWINDVYGGDIKEVVWDTPSGRELISAEGHGTSSDMFIQLKDGRNIGISLKQTTNVFLLNGGYNKQHKLLVSSLSETLEPDEIDAFEKATSVDTYWSGNPDDGQDNGFYGDLKTINNEFKGNQDFKDVMLQRINDYKNLSEEDFEGIFDSDKYLKYVNETEKIISELPHVNKEEMKYIAKIMKDPVIREQFPQFYDALRNQEVKLTQSILRQASSNENVANGLKKICMDGMHVEDILFGKSEKLDEFITLYGNQPAVELDKGVLLKIFGMQDTYERYLSIDDADEKEEFKQQLLDEIKKKIVIDIKDGATSGEIKIKHEDGELHLFGVKARAKALGASPALEMDQTTFMGNVIKEGTTDVSQWKSSTKTRFVNARVKEIMEDMEDANTEQRQSLKQEIDKLKAL